MMRSRSWRGAAKEDKAAAAKFTSDRALADPEKAARRLMQHAHAFETMQDGRIYIEKLNGPFLYGDRGTPAEYAAGLDARLARAGWKSMTVERS